MYPRFQTQCWQSHRPVRFPQHADYCIFTSETGVDLAATAGWKQRGTTVCAVGDQTATALCNRGYSVDIVPSTFTSTGLVDELSTEVEGQTVELARSAHGSEVLVEGLEAAGGIVSETALYRLKRPETAGQSVSLAVDGKLDGILFTSPKTIEHFVQIATERDAVAALQRELEETIVGAIGAQQNVLSTSMGSLLMLCRIQWGSHSLPRSPYVEFWIPTNEHIPSPIC